MTFTTGTVLTAAALNDACGLTTGTTFTTTTPEGGGWYRTVGQMVEFHYISTGTVAAATAVTPDFTLPVGYRPAARSAVAAAAGAASIRLASAIVDPNGTFQTYNGHTSATVVECHGLYMVA